MGMTDILVQINEINREELYRFQLMCDQWFFPPISSRANLKQYSEKLHVHSERITVKIDGSLAGVLCVYANNLESKEAFISYVSVSEEHKGGGVGKILMRTAIDLCSTKGMISIRLEVAENNLPAIKLYRGFDFQIEKLEGMIYTMVRRNAN